MSTERFGRPDPAVTSYSLGNTFGSLSFLCKKINHPWKHNQCFLVPLHPVWQPTCATNSPAAHTPRPLNCTRTTSLKTSLHHKPSPQWNGSDGSSSALCWWVACYCNMSRGPHPP
ncbi:unnamed protein product [Gadus morhua 'NCC']